LRARQATRRRLLQGTVNGREAAYACDHEVSKALGEKKWRTWIVVIASNCIQALCVANDDPIFVSCGIRHSQEFTGLLIAAWLLSNIQASDHLIVFSR
jgi:hypothetical protein